MTTDNTGTTPAAAAWRRPGSLDELCAALDAFSGWEPVERARRAPELIEAAKTVLADERSAAMGEARTQGMGVTALARELGVTRQKVYDALNRTPPGRGETPTALSRELDTATPPAARLEDAAAPTPTPPK